jgi:carboxyl-terminal processing protease
LNKIKKHIISKIVLFLSIFSMIFTTAFADDNILNQVKQLIKDYYVEPVKDEVYNASSIDDVLKSLNDPYSDYFTREEFNDYLDKMGYGFSGIGISIEVVPEGVKIISVSQESSAQKTGLIPGDLIVWANGYYLSGLSIDKIMSYIKGRTGSKVVIIVKRDGKYYAYSIVRKESAVPSVEGGMINHTAYIRIYSFNESTADEFNDMLVNLNRSNPSNYIIDLRYNPGGYLNSTLDIAGYFIGNNTAVIGKNKKNVATDI